MKHFQKNIDGEKLDKINKQIMIKIVHFMMINKRN